MTENIEKPQLNEVTLKLVWENPSDIQTIYANNLFITHAGNEFYLVFGEMSLLTDIDANNLPEQLDIKPVAKIAISPENMERFSDAIAGNLKVFKEKIAMVKEQ